MIEEKCIRCGEKVAWIGVVANLVFMIIKILVGLISHSKGLIADGLHSASNIVTAFAIGISHRLARKKANEEFQYGFGKAEFLAAAAVSLLIIIMAIVLITVSIKHLLHSKPVAPHWIALVVTVISIVGNEMLFRYMHCAGTRLKSQTIIANAWANRADSFSSVAVIIGVVGSQFGIPHLDPIAAIFVVIVIIKISVEMLLESVRALMDGSVNNLYGEEIRDCIIGLDEVKGITDLRTRQVGRHVWAEMEIRVSGDCSIEHINSIRKMIRKLLFKRIPSLERITINVTPCRGEECL